jgi:O-antigen/teichoic acid export membrane protein
MSIMRNSALAFAPKALAIVTGILTSVITARYLGPSGRGVLSLVLLSVAVLSLIGDLGLGASIT